MSDLHLETVRYPDAYRPRCAGFDVLVVAGDVWKGSSARALATVAQLAQGKPAVFVLGNHEPWHRKLEAERAAARHGVTLLDDGEATLAGVRFVGGTLWADGKLGGQDATPGHATGEMVRVARDGGGTRLITTGDEAALHRRTLEVVEAALARPGDGCPVVVVTHHAPYPLCMPAAHRSSWVAGNSASDLSHLTDTGRAALWVYAHLHHWWTWCDREARASCATRLGRGSATPISVMTWWPGYDGGAGCRGRVAASTNPSPVLSTVRCMFLSQEGGRRGTVRLHDGCRTPRDQGKEPPRLQVTTRRGSRTRRWCGGWPTMRSGRWASRSR